MKNFVKRYYQWIPMSTNRNDIVYLVEVFKDDDVTFYKFNDDSICAESLILPYNASPISTKTGAMIELVDYQYSWKFEKPQALKTTNFADVGRENNDNTPFDIPMLDESYTIISPVLDGRCPTKINIDDYIKIEKVKEPVSDVINDCSVNNDYEISHTDEFVAEAHTDELIIFNAPEQDKRDNINNKIDVDPIKMLIEKSIKTQSLISMDLTVNLPGRSLFNVINENFDDGADKFIELILEEIDYKIIKDSLKHALLNAYKAETNEID